MKAYKAFDKDMKCRDFQFEIGKTYETENAKLCESGFHACENPLDVLNYYDLTDSVFAEVELDATNETNPDDSKRVGKRIEIKASLDLKGFIKASIDFLFEQTKDVKVKKGDSSQLAASGDSSNLAASGHYSKLAASGHYSKLAASGDSSNLAASGDSSKLAASGHFSQLAASGDYSNLAASGDYSKLAASGHSSKLAASGHYSKLAASGDNSVVMNAGYNGICKASKGSWITLAEWKDNIPIHVVTKKVDGIKIKADTFYQLKKGKFVEVIE